FGSNENNQIEFNEEDDDENKFIDENKIESNKENEEKFETRSKEIHRHLYLQCKRGGQPQNTSNLTVDTRQKKRMSKRCGCPYLLKAIPKDSKWKVVEVINKHNHPKAKDARVFHEHHRLTQEAKRTAVQMLKAGAKPKWEPIATRRDILNLSSRIHISEENASMEALIVGMEKRGYSVRREDQKVKMARRFPEVVLADATYKTNVYKLPFVNFVGISNLGVNRLQTFGIAGAWISDESEKSYIWVVEKLASLIFFDISPLVFVTDNDAALIGALKKVFPQSENLLCTWHVLNNFKKNLRKHFDDNSYDEIIKIVDRIIHLRDYGAHSAMKHAIETSGSLTKSFNSLDRWIRLHYEELSLQYENESVNIDPLLTWDDKNRLKPLLGRVAQFALNKIKNELLSITTYQACLCESRINYNIPCRHILPLNGPVMLSIIPKRCLLFPDQVQVDSNYLMKDLSSTGFDNFSLKSRLYKIETRYMNFLDEQQKSDLLSKLDGILEVPEVKLSEIKIPEQITGKGRPCGTKRLPIALENMEAKKKKKVGVVKKKPIENVNSSNSLLNGSALNIEALAIAIRGNEENWNLVKLAMNSQLNKRIEVYKDWLGYDIDLLKWILESRASPCISSLWFLSPNCAQLAADTFS
ncbi:20039_t:CDS:2, partial [Racocetra fulgida]